MTNSSNINFFTKTEEKVQHQQLILSIRTITEAGPESHPREGCPMREQRDPMLRQVRPSTI